MKFVALYTLAQIGAFTAFVPLLQIIVPMEALRIAPGGSTALLSTVSVVGAIVASVGNLVAGALSDITPRAWGRRRSWLLGGLLLVLLSYAAVAAVRSATGLVLAIVFFQLAFNAMFSPLTALLADRVPARQRGLVAALLGLGAPIGSVIGAAAVGLWTAALSARLELIGAIVAATLLPLTFLLKETANPTAAPPTTRPPGGFAMALCSRLCVVAALNLVQTYMLLFLQGRHLQGLHLPGPAPGAVARMVAVATCANVAGGLAAGRLADVTGRLQPFIAAGAGTVALATILMPWAGTWPELLLLAALWGCGGGVFYATDLPLMARLLPSTQKAGRGFGVVNLANTLPQIVMPLCAFGLLHGAVPDYRALFGLAGCVALAGGVLILQIRPAR